SWRLKTSNFQFLSARQNGEGKRWRRLPQTVGVLKPQTFNFYRLGKTGRESAGWGIGLFLI
ncbi:MAG TPA: hypothetical protein DF774_05420, partial [Rheinheimera sp.]|uniref:hypothetical protein n=1 Tax=Rheinheimera sp. TaxID=1869214 RepID=UPI000ED28FB7